MKDTCSCRDVQEYMFMAFEVKFWLSFTVKIVVLDPKFFLDVNLVHLNIF